MDRRKEACAIIKSINEYHNKKLKDYILIKRVCDFFDLIKNDKLSEFFYYFINT